MLPNFLNSFTRKLGLSSSTPTSSPLPISDRQFQFFSQVLLATAENDGNPQVVYSLLQANLDLLDDNFAQVFRELATITLSKVELDKASSIAVCIHNFSNRIQQFPLGRRAINLEIAIAGYEVTSTVFTRERFPTDWANTQNSLGSAYNNRIRGERAENIERAITAYNAAFSVYTRDLFPYEWARTQNNLGTAYTDRIRGERAENIERAIAAYNAALLVRTRESFPTEWAMIQSNLGLAYYSRIRGEKAENLELAIAAFKAALSIRTREAFPYDWAKTQNHLATAYTGRIRGEKAENLELAIAAYKVALFVYTREAFPYEWAGTHNNLGLAYKNRISGEKAENLEQAIAAYNAALSVRTREAFPYDWAGSQNGLGNAYKDRIRGDKAENLEQAIAAYHAALSVYTREAFPYYWALTQNNLGAVYYSRIRGDRAENLEQAIAAYKAALSVRTRKAFPYDWARTQNGLGNAYKDRIRGNRAKNLEQAIAAYKAALSVHTPESFPYDWAMAQNNLANAYKDRIREEKAENIQQAIAAYKAALSVYTREAFLQENAGTLLNLGLTYQISNQLPLAFDTFESAIETVELLRGEILSGDEIKQKLAEEWNQLYQRMVAVCLEMNRYTEAIEYVERSKARNLVELILSRDLHNLFPPEIARQLQQLQNEIAVGQNQLQTATADNPTALAQHLKQLRQQRNELQDRYLRIGSRFKFDQFQATLDNRTAIIEWYITQDKFLAFILSPGTGGISVWQSTSDDLKALLDWDNIYRKDYNEQKENWRIQLPQRLEELTKILHLDELIEQLPKACNRLILIPHRFLHLFPLHSLSLSHDGKQVCLLDLFPEGVSYAPSCQLLLQAQKRQRLNFTHLFAIQNPTNDLTYTDLEVQAVADYFHSVDILKQEKATLAAINDANLNAIHCAHFSCHGYFNLNNPRKSALILADAPVAVTPAKPNAERYLILRDSEVHDLDNCLTLNAILSLNLEQCRLVTLSACESGLIDFNNTSDEYIGLPNGFLVAGSPAVVSSLWTVNDLSTALLTIRFYENLKFGLTPALALNQAQIWLRNATKEELQQWTNSLNLDATERRPLRRFFRDIEAGAQPFASPYYWAAFCAIGQ